MYYISANSGGNVHDAVSFINRMPLVCRENVFSIQGDGMNPIIVFRTLKIEDANAICRYFRQIEFEIHSKEF